MIKLSEVRSCVKEEVDVLYHWRELPQVSFLSTQNTSFVATKVCLPRQKYVCRNKHTFVATEICLRHVFVATNISRDKSMLVATEIFVATEIYVCRDKHTFVATKVLSRQKLHLWQLPLKIVLGSPSLTIRTVSVDRKKH